MPNHPNRGPKGPSPNGQAFRALRLSLGLSQTAAGEHLDAKLRTVQDWESGARNMPGAKLELFRLKMAR